VDGEEEIIDGGGGDGGEWNIESSSTVHPIVEGEREGEEEEGEEE